MPAKMIFSPLSFQIRRATLGTLICLAGICLARAGDDHGQPIEIVPMHGAPGTNLTESLLPTRNLDNVLPGAIHPFNLYEPSQDMPEQYVPPARPLTQREQEWLDRRRNWVFMTPEELMSDTEADKILGLKDDQKDRQDKEPTTAMERYYQHLYESDRPAAANQFSDSDSGLGDKQTNSLFSVGQMDGPAHGLDSPFESPFNSRPDPGIFQPARATAFSDVFDLNTDTTTPSEETIREKKEAEAHMDAFKEMWGISQPSSSSFASSSSSSFSAAIQPVFGTASPSASSSTGPQNSSSSQDTLSSDRSMLMQHPTFNVPQRRF